MEKKTNKIKSILVVDDDSEVLELIKDLLECEGFRVVVAPDGQLGSVKAKNEKFDLIISDLNMPKQDGIRFLTNLAKDKQQNVRLPPMIVISGEVTPNAREICISAKIPILEKPFKPEDLIDLVTEKITVSEKVATNTSCPNDEPTKIPLRKVGETIFAANSKIENLYLIKSGKVQLFYNDKLYIEVGPGDIFGDASVISGLPSSVSAKVSEDAELAIIPGQKILKILEDQPSWFHAIVKKLAIRLIECKKN